MTTQAQGGEQGKAWILGQLVKLLGVINIIGDDSGEGYMVEIPASTKTYEWLSDWSLAGRVLEKLWQLGVSFNVASEDGGPFELSAARQGRGWDGSLPDAILWLGAAVQTERERA
jgi:hypothetical protein